uniref:Uncharacterized protein n=1 Tax=Clostridium perfringens TaxID=1502 RepID=Q2L5Y6_CLOPF|nr:hypothetical protein [Clostridium perfringens CPE str. F4969]
MTIAYTLSSSILTLLTNFSSSAISHFNSLHICNLFSAVSYSLLVNISLINSLFKYIYLLSLEKTNEPFFIK